MLRVVVRSANNRSFSQGGDVKAALAAVTSPTTAFMLTSAHTVSTATTRYAQVRTGISNALGSPNAQRWNVVSLLRMPLNPAEKRKRTTSRSVTTPSVMGAQ